jgi:hypothetical protein
MVGGRRNLCGYTPLVCCCLDVNACERRHMSSHPSRSSLPPGQRNAGQSTTLRYYRTASYKHRQIKYTLTASLVLRSTPEHARSVSSPSP